MKKYHKIRRLFLHDPTSKGKYKKVLEGQFSRPEFEYLAGNQWVWTEKIDGVNLRVDWDCEKVTFAGRTDDSWIHPDLLVRLGEMFPITRFQLPYHDTPMMLCGEGYGANVRKGGGSYLVNGVSFILFDVRIGDFWLEHHNVKDIASKLGIDVVPIVGHGTLYEAVEFVRQRFQSHIGMQMAEGVVARPKTEFLMRTGERIITKIKYRDFQR